MSPEAWIAVAVAAVSLCGHLIMIGAWKSTVEAALKRQSDRIDRLYERDERIFTSLDEIKKSTHGIELWIARREGQDKA